ncbi:sensor histidine kinase [Amycolatopsis sp. 195334CR]|uniref:sensor histidine kinase n=1 Tax=Amycolatopsis sp. 195334CR TaxID=2814588 RepID=UPI001A8E962A|nr:histidine kinase [Amycolatopsis sp. 195334CR]MBN6034700.1 sensor histidine kinase [Amycolatopsis sp. 195334CR]
MNRWWPKGPAGDVVLAGLVLVLVLSYTLGQPEPPGWFGLGLIVFSCGVLAVRRRYPVAVAVATMVGVGLYYPLVGAGSPVLLTLMLALYTLSAEGRLRAAAVVAGITVFATLAGELASAKRHVDDVAMFMLLGWIVAMLALGRVKRQVELGREEEARRRATEERLRIARELHDALGHHLSLITVQAGAALHAGDPEQSTGALSAIKDASKQALRELRSTLGVLRAPVDATPGLDRVGELLDHARAMGLEVTAELGEPRPVPPELGLAGYRIVQEALTNTIRHSGASTVVVRIRYGDDEVRVEIEDNGSGGPITPGGGIRGMRERVRAAGGELTMPARETGLAVHARLPIGGRR